MRPRPCHLACSLSLTLLSDLAKHAAMSKPLVSICRYKVKPGKQQEMEKLLAVHWPALRAAGLVTEERARVYRGLPSKKPGGEHGAERIYVEVMTWIDEKSPDLAHQTPEVMAVWEPMGAICEEMDFPGFELVDLPAK
jgi:hypothetical protein